MPNRLAILLAIALSGCSLLATKEAAIGCQVADMATTTRALHLNHLAYETNSLPIHLLFALKIALIWYIWQSNWEANKETEGMRAAVSIIGCAPVPGNLQAAKYSGG